MNVYDQAHGLAAAIKESGEFKEFSELKKKIEMDPSLSSMVQDYEKKTMEMQAKQLTGEGLSQEDMQKLQQLTQILMMNPTAGQYLQATMRFSLMMNDVFQIIGDATGMQFNTNH